MGASSIPRSGLLLKLAQSSQEGLQRSVGPAKLAFPDDNSRPSCVIQRLDYLFISGGVCQEFRLPEVRSRLGQHRKAAPFVMMPEASVYEDTRFEPRYYNVRLSWQVLAMQSIAIAVRMQKPAYEHFRLCVFSPDAGHHSGSSSRINDVHSEKFRYSVVS